LRKNKQSAGGRLAVMTVDQMISGGSNVLIAVLAARALSASGFGLFGIVFLVYMILVGVTRALVSDPLLVHPVESRERPGEAIGTAILLALPLAVGLAGAGFAIRLWDRSLGEALVVLAACLPLLVLQDVGRYLGFATRRPMRAVIIDSVWLVVMVGCVVVLLTRSGRTLPSFMAAWAGSGAAAGAILFVWYDIRSVRLSLRWLKETWGLAWRYLVSYTSMQGAALGASSSVGAISGTSALGGLQGVLLLVRPFTMFATAAVGASTSEVAHAIGDRERIWRHATLSSSFCGVVAALNGVVMILLPAKIGRIVLGDSWHVAHPLLVAAGVYILCIGLVTGPQGGLYGSRAMKQAMRLSVMSMALMLIGAVLGAALNGAKGALWLVDLSQAITLLAWWVTFAVYIRTTEPAATTAMQVEPFGLRALLRDAARTPAAPIVAGPVASSPVPSVASSSTDPIAIANTSGAASGNAASTWLPAELS
jgi:O-antigen/teichoic acid export membrane protein